MPGHTEEEKKKKRDEEEALRQQRKIIGRIEKRRGELIAQGSSLVGSRRQAAAEQEKAQEGKDIKEARISKGTQELEEVGFFKGTQKLPQRVQLDIPSATGAITSILERNLPIIGGALATIEGIEAEASRGRPEDIRKPARDVSLKETLIQNPETAREIALKLIQQDVLNKGLNRSERFGAVIEAIPVVGTAANKFARGLISNPKANVDTLVADIDSLGSDATNLGEKALRVNPIFLLDELNRMEDDIARMEQRIKLLSLTSEILRENPDEINKIENSILNAKIRVFNNQQIVAQGALTVPSDAVIAIELLKLERGLNKNDR